MCLETKSFVYFEAACHRIWHSKAPRDPFEVKILGSYRLEMRVACGCSFGKR